MRRWRDAKQRLVQERGMVLRAVSGQTDDLLQIQDASGTVVGYVSAAGAVFVSRGVIFAGLTTAQRNALAQQDRPTGTVIRNTDTGLLEQNVGTAAAPTWRYVGRLPIDVNGAGTLAGRPAANTVESGFTYFATDDRGGTLYRSDGNTWSQVAVSVGDSRLTDQRTPLDGSVTPPKIGSGLFDFQQLRQGGMDVERALGPNRHVEGGVISVAYSGFSATAAGSAAYVNPFAAAPAVVVSRRTGNPPPLSFGTQTPGVGAVGLLSFSDGAPGYTALFDFLAEGQD